MQNTLQVQSAARATASDSDSLQVGSILGNTNSSLKEYLDQEELMIPVETIIARTEAKDYRFFLESNNFLKVVDTLEKFQENHVDRLSDSGKEFMLFKASLYQMYEVSNRSGTEHEAYSFRIERSNLRWLYNANLDYCNELVRVNREENMTNHGALNGAVFKQKMLNTDRVRGVGAFAAVAAASSHWMPITLALAGLGVPAATPAVGLAATLFYGMHKLNVSDTVSSITIDDSTGNLVLDIAHSAVSSRKIMVSPTNVKSVVALGQDNLGADDCESNLIQVTNYTDMKTGEAGLTGQYIIPAEAHRDKPLMDWILSDNSTVNYESTTDADFNDLMVTNFRKNASTGGHKGVEAYFTNGIYKDERIELNAQETETTLLALQ